MSDENKVGFIERYSSDDDWEEAIKNFAISLDTETGKLDKAEELVANYLGQTDPDDGSDEGYYPYYGYGNSTDDEYDYGEYEENDSMGSINTSKPVATSVCNCKGYDGPGGPCYDGPGGAAYSGPGGPAYDGPGGPCYSGPGGPRYSGPGGPAYDGPGGDAYSGPGGPCYDGPGGPCYDGPGGGINCPAVCR